MNNSDGELTLGGYNTNYFTGPIAWTPLIDKGYWEFELESMKLNGQSITTATKAVLDTGTSIMAGPTAEVKKLADAVGAFPIIIRPNEWLVDCKKLSQLPNITIGIGGQTYTLTGSEYVIDSKLYHTAARVSCITDILTAVCLFVVVQNLHQECLFGFTGIDIPSPR
jgi:hypothetical protein